MSKSRFHYSPMRTFEAVGSPKAPHGVQIDGPCVSILTMSLNEIRSVQMLRRCEAEDLRDQLNAALRAIAVGERFDADAAEAGSARSHRGSWPMRNHRTLAQADHDGEVERIVSLLNEGGQR